ncbi:MAG: Gfo/Idh/MocA family oxidoreductase [Kiritimatiellae bacterium]|jgi:myo-inositol 2-dehydrogenase/D-chiro-inositol 1-dehydrogenase|nr:Gfo/Idh/MocA family oxidoreductase [Kiritimatiellia bacterium]
MDSRRSFLRKGGMGIAAALAAPTIIPASVLGQSAPSKQITIGMVGTGRQAVNANLKNGFLKLKNCRVVAINDVDSWRMENCQKIISKAYGAFSAVKKYDDYRELIADKGVDAIMCSTSDQWHVPVGITAAMAGKPICMEKALSIGYNHSRALIEAVKANRVANRLDSEFRSNKHFRKTVQGVRNGVLGKLTHVTVGVPAELNGASIGPQATMPVPKELNYDMWQGPAFEAPYTMKRVHEPGNINSRPGWMRIEDYCNGMITNWGAHLWDIALWGMDREYERPVTVEGTGSFGKGLWNTLEEFDLKYTYKDGFVVSYKIDKPYVKFEGEKGWLQIVYPCKLTASDPALIKAMEQPGEFDFSGTLSDKADFLRSIETGKSALEPLEVGHNVYATCHMGLCCAELGRKLTWDSAKERFVDDNAANAMLNRPFRDKWLNKDVAAWMNKFQACR